MKAFLRRRAARRLLVWFFDDFDNRPDGQYYKTDADLIVEEWLWRAADESAVARAIRDAFEVDA